MVMMLCSVYDIRVGEPTLPFQQDYNRKKTEFLFLQAIKVLESRKKIESDHLLLTILSKMQLIIGCFFFLV